ncbi:MAG: hypothetical protein HYS27_26925 [Deltaproteobacteria bacterium]|nr:hypothetical protein [Deltaproteobacteria bacterium]
MNNPHGRDEAGRDAHGRFAPGASGNPGGRPRLPGWFRDGGAEALRYLLDVATGAVPVERDELRVRAAEWCAARVFGRPQAAEDEHDPPWVITPAVEGLLRLAYGDGVRSSGDLIVKLAAKADEERAKAGPRG